MRTASTDIKQHNTEQIVKLGSSDNIVDTIEGIADKVIPHSKVLTGIFLLMILYTVYLASPVIMPIVMAILLSLVLSPIVALLNKIHLPPPISAAIVLFTLGILFFSGVYLLAEPAALWLDKLPQALNKIDTELSILKSSVNEIQQTAKNVENITTLGQTDPSKVVIVKQATLTEMLLHSTPQLLTTLLAISVLVYFLLASGDSFLRKLVRILPTLHDKKRAVEIVRSIQTNISIYLSTITMINLGMGFFLAIILYFLKVPNAALWGILTAVVAFIPYVGVAISATVLMLVGLTTFGSLFAALKLPLILFGLDFIQGQLIAPIAISRRLSLNPVVIFIAFIVLGWMWGIAGAIIAVPLLGSLKIISEQIESWQPIAEFLEQ